MENNTRIEDSSKYPIKKCHCLEGKYFVVIDQSIIQSLNYISTDNSDLYFEEVLIPDGSITLRQFRLRNIHDRKIDDSDERCF